MALTKEQLLYINNVLYSSNPPIYGSGQTSFEGKTLGDLANMISNNPGLNADALMTSYEWKNIAQTIRNDSQLSSLQIVDAVYIPNTGDVHCLLVDPSTNEAVVAFKGTGGGEWKDNFIAGSDMNLGGSDPTISPQQQSALDYANSLNLEQYSNVTVTGHSKGGNKAKLIALMNDNVDSCVSFDGQGFSDEFMAQHANEIAANQHKIQNHNASNDYVNILLNDIGEKYYYETQRCEDNFAKSHSPTSLFTSNSKMIPSQQNPHLQDLDAFLNSMLRSTNPKQKDAILDYAGEAIQAFLGTGGSPEKALEVLTDPRYNEQASDILAYLIAYERNGGHITDSMIGLLNEAGLPEFADYVNIARAIIETDALYEPIKNMLARGNDDPPNWVIYAIAGLTKTDPDLVRKIAPIVGRAGEKVDFTYIEPGTGADISVAGTHASFEVEYEPIDTHFDVTSTAAEASYIYVHFSELLECCNLLREALEEYNRAIDIVESASNELATKWEGVSKDAFCNHQQNAFRWYRSISLVVDGIISLVKTVRSMYMNLEDEVTKIVHG